MSPNVGFRGEGKPEYPEKTSRCRVETQQTQPTYDTESRNRTQATLVEEGVVSKETVVLRRWGSSIQKFGFINGVDNVNWPPYRDSKS